MANKYKFVQVPTDYPGDTYNWKTCRRVLEHHLVWWQNTGHVVQCGENIHHKNWDKSDNKFENLELMKHGEHTKLHRPARRMYVTCAYCGKKALRREREIDWMVKVRGCNRFFCCREHAGKFSGPRNSRAGGRKGRR